MKPKHVILFLAVVLAFVLLFAHHRYVLADQRAGIAHSSATTNWVDTRLYFGIGPADAPIKGVPDAAWRDFLDHEVTPRFPSGLSVIDVYGQWQSPPETSPERIRSKLLIIDYPDTSDNEARIEAIRAAWKKRTGDQSVLKVTQPASVSF